MRFYPDADPSNFTEIPDGWACNCHNSNMTWKRKPLEPKHVIRYWRDLEGAKLETVLKKDLQFKEWPETRIRYPACLPQYYSMGNRFIRLESEAPVNYRCTSIPMNLTEVRQIKIHERKVANQNMKKLKLAQKLAKSNINRHLRKKP